MMGIHSKLKHLNEKQIEELIERYYSNEKVADLISYFEIDCKPADLVKFFPPEKLKDIFCPYCKIEMVKKRISRDRNDIFIYCPNCNHKFEDNNCKCDNCEMTKFNIINELCSRDIKKVNISELSFIERVYLATVLRGIDWEELMNEIRIFPLNSTDKKLLPRYEKEVEILKKLFNKGIIKIDFLSDFDAFTGSIADGTYAKNFYVHKARYILNMKYSTELINPNIDLKNEDLDEIYSLLRYLLLEECYEYLDFQMGKVGFSFNPGKITEEVFNELLNNFSIGQVYNIIYTSITRATRYYQEGGVYRKQAANSVVTRCRSYGERILANGWDLKPFNRSRECEESILSSLFFNRILSIGDNYFNIIFSKENFENIIDEKLNNSI
ncbi:hypothetical protein [Clostridium perfringens]|jgi:hypothetical protein|uniref:hypothetical protein n=2 Tax=Bacillota TaxID=1239 RepID=UPI001A2531A3|nr:hypothetical protein [Clostridium perfringens]